MTFGVAEALLRCSHAGDSLSRAAEEHLFRVCEAGKVFLVRRAIDLLEAHPESVVLSQYSGDSTPVALKSYASYESQPLKGNGIGSQRWLAVSSTSNDCS
eukprot:2170395-Amphidinium_carterae.1